MSKTFVVRSAWRIFCVLVCVSLTVSAFLRPMQVRRFLNQKLNRRDAVAQPLKTIWDESAKFKGRNE